MMLRTGVRLLPIYTAGRLYHAVQYTMILHTALQWQKQKNINETKSSQKTLHMPLLLSILETIDDAIMAFRFVYAAPIPIGIFETRWV